MTKANLRAHWRGIALGIAAMTVFVTASNLLVEIHISPWLTYGALTYPGAFLVTDLMNRLYGPAAARRVILSGFVVGILCSFIGTQIMGEFGPLVTLRIAIASGTGFLVAQLVDVTVFNRLRTGTWWRAPLASSLIGSALDTAIFFTIAFATALTFLEPSNDVSWANETLPLLGVGPMAPLWVSLGTADFMVKLTLAMIALVPFRLLVTALKKNAES